MSRARYRRHLCSLKRNRAMRKRKLTRKKTTVTHSSFRRKRDPRLIGAEWDDMHQRWWHPAGDEYLQRALASDAAFTAAVNAEAEVQRKRPRQVAAMLGEQ